METSKKVTRNSSRKTKEAQQVYDELIELGIDVVEINAMDETEQREYLQQIYEGSKAIENSEDENDAFDDSLEDDVVTLTKSLGNKDNQKLNELKQKVYPHRLAFNEDLSEKDRTKVSVNKFIVAIYCKNNYRSEEIDDFLDFLEDTFGQGTVIQIGTSLCSAIDVITQLKARRTALGIDEKAEFYAYFGTDFIDRDDLELEEDIRISQPLYDRLISMNLLQGELYSLSSALEEFAS